MARPIKDGVSYWPFDVDMLDDKKFKLIRGEFGIKGAYIALVILNSVYKDNGYYKKWDEDDCYLVSESAGDGCTPRLVNEVLTGCIRRGLFNERLFDAFGILTSAGIQRRFFQMVKNSRNKIILYREYLLIDLNDQGLSEGVLNKVVLKTVSRWENPGKTQGNPDKTQGNSLKENKEKRKINKKENKIHSFCSTSEKSKQKPFYGELGEGLVILSEEQIEDLLERLSIEEFDHYVEVVKNCEKKGKKFVKKTHYQAILDMVEKDRQIKKKGSGSS